MSEKTPTKEEWLKWRADTDSQLKQLTENLKQQVSLGEREKPETKEHPVHTLEELLDCPECMKTGEAKVLKHVVDKHFKDADFECVECGLPVRGEESGREDWNCPSCDGKEAREKD